MQKMSLNNEQLEAVKHFEGPMMVLAGPGSGKTTVIAHRIQFLINEYKVAPSDILVITFTKSAAAEMQQRFEKLIGTKSAVSFGTFHSVFFRILRRSCGYTIGNVLKEQERTDILHKIASKTQNSTDEDEDLVRLLSTEISFVKNELIDLENYHSLNLGTDVFRTIAEQYEQEKQQAHKIDFDDMLIKCYELFKNNPGELKYWKNRYKFILVDEFQDINRVQYQCIQMLVKPACHLFVVGDDDQSIYQFRGASPEFLLKFPKDFGNTRTVVLSINYRSNDRIIKASAKIIGENKKRYPKVIKGTERKGGKLSVMTSDDIGSESIKIANRLRLLSNEELNDTAIIYRTNIQGRAFVDAFRDMKIPFQIKDRLPSLYEHWILKDICAYIRLSLDRTSDSNLIRIINRPSRYVSRQTINAGQKMDGYLLNNLLTGGLIPYWQAEKIEELIFYLNTIKTRATYEAFKYIRHAVNYEEYLKGYAEFRKMSHNGLMEILNELQESAKPYPNLKNYLTHVDNAILSAKEDIRTNYNSNGCTLTTMHSAKGMEYKTVYIAGAVDGVIPHEKSRTEMAIEEERRLLYVAMTRAKENLILSVIKSRYDTVVNPTQFLKPLRESESSNRSVENEKK